MSARGLDLARAHPPGLVHWKRPEVINVNKINWMVTRAGDLYVSTPRGWEEEIIWATVTKHGAEPESVRIVRGPDRIAAKITIS